MLTALMAFLQFVLDLAASAVKSIVKWTILFVLLFLVIITGFVVLILQIAQH